MAGENDKVKLITTSPLDALIAEISGQGGYRKVRYKTEFVLEIDTNGQVVTKEIELDRDIVAVLAVKLSTNRPSFGYYRGLVGLEIDNQEVFDDNFEARNLIAGPQVPPQESYTIIHRDAGSGKVKVRYTDEDNPDLAFQPYKVRVMLVTAYK